MGAALKFSIPRIVDWRKAEHVDSKLAHFINFQDQFFCYTSPCPCENQNIPVLKNY